MFTIIIAFACVIVACGIGFFFLYFTEDDTTFKKKLADEKERIVREKNEANIRIPSGDIFLQWLKEIAIQQENFFILKEHMHAKIVGMEEVINAICVCLLAGWHILVEGVPWLAKTKTIATFSDLVGLQFQRIQFTPDMLPSDIIGFEMYDQHEHVFKVQLGPVVANVILADEINRTTPKVQAALLEAMQEKQVTIWGKTHTLPSPFMVLATQNPIEQEGTYPLPEAQLDRFMLKIIVGYPTLQEERKVLTLSETENELSIKKCLTAKQVQKCQEEVNTITVVDELKTYITRLVAKTRGHHPSLRYGASPRASLSLLKAARAIAFLEGRDYVMHEDIQRAYIPVLRHRIILTYDALVQGVKPEDVLCELAKEVGI